MRLNCLRMDQLYKQFREACLFRARNQFGSELITSEYERIYYRVLGIEADIPVPICE